MIFLEVKPAPVVNVADLAGSCSGIQVDRRGLPDRSNRRGCSGLWISCPRGFEKDRARVSFLLISFRVRRSKKGETGRRVAEEWEESGREMADEWQKTSQHTLAALVATIFFSRFWKRVSAWFQKRTGKHP